MKNNENYFYLALKIKHKIYFFVIFMFLNQFVFSQNFYILNNETISINKTQISIFSNIINNGSLVTSDSSSINFYGLNWENNKSATLPIISKGGIFIFDNTNASGNGYKKQQSINAGYSQITNSGPIFPSVKINNFNGLKAIGFTDFKINNNLNFVNGKLFANGNNILIGDIENAAGDITGYNAERYIVLDNTLNNGFLKLPVYDSLHNVIFPIGPDSITYTPVSILYKGVKQFIQVRSFKTVLERAISGKCCDDNFVQTTWNIQKQLEDSNSTDIYIQHPESIEGYTFTSNRNNSFITRFDNNLKIWDKFKGSVPLEGNISTDNSMTKSFLNFRNFKIGKTEYFSKTIEQVSIDFNKNLDTIIKINKSSYILNFTFYLKNTGESDIYSIVVSDNLEKIFPNDVEITKNFLYATGGLIINPYYKGIGIDTNLLLINSFLLKGSIDTIKLSLNINFQNNTGTYYNTAFAKGTINFGANESNTKIITSSNGNIFNANFLKTPIIINPSLNVFEIPGGFSPNNDRINDFFVLKNTEKYNIKLEVFNRWGTKVYESKEFYYNDWDGKSNQNISGLNIELAAGTYYYVVHIFDKNTGKLIERKIGFIILKRD